MEEIIIRQGDQYSIPFTIMLDGSIVTDKLINGISPDLDGDVEIVIGKLRKTYRKGEIKYNNKTYTFDFPMTQRDTFSLRGGMRLSSQVRVKLRKFNKNEDSTIFSYDGPIICIINSLSKEQI